MGLKNQKLINLLQFRIKAEEESSRLYKAMAIYLNYEGYHGAAKLWCKYAEEERAHAEWSYEYLLDLDVMPIVDSLVKPASQFEGLYDVILKSLNHEYVVTEQCQELARVASEEGDYMTLEFAQKYLREQREEIGKLTNLVDRLKAFGTSKEALRFLDNELNNLA